MIGTLRRTVDVVSVLAAAGLIAFISYASSDHLRERQTIGAVAANVDRFRQVLAYRAAANEAEVNQRGWPVTVDPQWFNGDPPRNLLVSPERPWVEVATPNEAQLMDPPVRMTLDPKLASFWYNPYQGIIRARVPVSINDAKALSLYNAVNGTHLESIYAPAPADDAKQASATGQPAATTAPPDGMSPASQTASVLEEPSPDSPTGPTPTPPK